MAVNSASHILKIVIQVVDKATAGMNSVTKSTNNIDKGLKRVNSRMGTFDMRLLSVMFGGMALQRAFGGMLRGLVNTFIKAEDNTSGLSQATNRLSASWEFMKFSIMEALNTEFFIAAIDQLVQFIKWVGQLDDKWKVTFLSIAGGLFIIGTGMMIIGQTKLGWDAIFGMGGFLGAGSKIMTTLGWGGIMGILLGIAIMTWAVIDKWDEMKKVGIALWDNLKVPLTSIKDSLDKISTAAGFKDIFDMISGAGVTAFAALGAILINVAFAIDLIVINLRNLVNGIKALVTGDFVGFAKIQIESIADDADWFDRWTKTNADYLTAIDKIDITSKGEPSFTGAGATGSWGGYGATGSWGEDTLTPILEQDEVTKNLNKSIDITKSSTDLLTDSYKDKLIPKITEIITTLTGKDGLLAGIKQQGEEMDTISGEKTTGFNEASQSRIEQMNSEISKYDEYINKQKEALSDFGSSIDYYSQTSPVSD